MIANSPSGRRDSSPIVSRCFAAVLMNRLCGTIESLAMVFDEPLPHSFDTGFHYVHDAKTNDSDALTPLAVTEIV